MTKKIFISYASDDFLRVRDVANHLQELGFEVWMDVKNLYGGDLWRPELVQAISTCDTLLLFLSEISMKSINVRREIDLASEKRKKIIPIKLDEVDIVQDLQFQLAGIQWLDVSKSDWMMKLIIAIGKSEVQSSFQHELSDLRDSSVNPNKDEEKGSGHSVGGVYFGSGNINIGGDVIGRDQTKGHK